MRRDRNADRWVLPPITIAELREAGIAISASCPICRRFAEMDPRTIEAPVGADMKWLSHALACTRCGRKGGMSAVPVSRDWIRHLRATGQTERLPWNSAFVEEE